MLNFSNQLIFYFMNELVLSADLLMKFRLTIDVPEETIMNYQKESKNYVDIITNTKNLEEFIKSIVEDQITWEVDEILLIDKKEFKKIQEYFRSME